MELNLNWEDVVGQLSEGGLHDLTATCPTAGDKVMRHILH